MSTDWIKMRVDLRTHPKVVRMASALKADKLRVIGGLFAVWSIFDAHSSDGILEGYTFESIDDDLHWKGFARAMAGIEWLVYDESQGEGLMAPRFEEHNGQSAKRRAMETERKRLEREAEKSAADAKKAETNAGQVSARDADKSVTREEKRREEEKDQKTTAAARLVDQAENGQPDQRHLTGITPPAPKPVPYAVPDCPYGQLLEAYHAELAMLPAVSVLNDARKEHMRARWREVCSQERFDLDAGLEWFRWFFAHAAKSKLLTGRSKPSRDTGRVWHATFDWLLLPSNFAKVIDGNYLDERAMA